MKIYIIHNNNDHIRAQNIKDQFASQTAQYEYEIVEAVMNDSQPAVGIMQSFKKCIQTAIKQNEDEICILEDDFKCLTKNSIEQLFKINKRFDPDGILLGSCYEGDLFKLDHQVSKLKNKLSGLNSLIINKKYYRRILNAQEPYQLDYYLSVMEDDFNIYVAHPFLIIQNDGYSYNVKKNTNYNTTLHLKYKLSHT